MKEYALEPDRLPPHEVSKMAVISAGAFPELSKELETMILTHAGVERIPEGPINPYVGEAHQVAKANHRRAVEQVRNHFSDPW